MDFEKILKEARKKLAENALNDLVQESEKLGLYGKQHPSVCLHLNCQNCHGTGVNKTTGSACIHGISCSCNLCRIT